MSLRNAEAIASAIVRPAGSWATSGVAMPVIMPDLTAACDYAYRAERCGAYRRDPVT